MNADVEQLQIFISIETVCQCRDVMMSCDVLVCGVYERLQHVVFFLLSFSALLDDFIKDLLDLYVSLISPSENTQQHTATSRFVTCMMMYLRLCTHLKLGRGSHPGSSHAACVKPPSRSA